MLVTSTNSHRSPRLTTTALRRLLIAFAVLLVPIAWFSMRYDPYAIDGDAVAYMDIADLIHAHRWAGVVNAYWHPLYPSLLLLGQLLFHPTRATELDAYYKVNFGIFLLEAAAVFAFTTALLRLRDRLAAGAKTFLIGTDALRLLGLALLVVASQRELTLGKVRPDGLLQALFLFGFAAMLQIVTAETLRAQIGFSTLMGLCFGLAYLTKSFALLLALLSIAAVVLFQYLLQKRPAGRALLPGATAFLVFAVVAGPYIAALSHQKHRLDFGDSGSLNYAWYVGGTEKFHLEPWQTGRFGTSDVHLIHPERQLLASPGIYSYKALPYGTLPPWFDASFFNERIVTHMHLGQLVRRDARNAVLVVRYLFNHPEAWLLLAVLLLAGARFARPGRTAAGSFWLLPLALGTAIWAIYGLVNVEERYVTVGYLVIVLSVFAALVSPAATPAQSSRSLPNMAALAVALLALLSLGESVRIAAEQHRQESGRGFTHGWQDAPVFPIATSLQQLGVRPGDEVACIGSVACVYDPYWMRLAGARTTTEVFFDNDDLVGDLTRLPNRDEMYRVVKGEGATVLVGHFDAGALSTSPLRSEGWQRLGNTDFFVRPLNLAGVMQQ